MRAGRLQEENPPDDELVRAARTGRLHAFGSLAVRYHGAVRSWLVPRCPPEVDAEDLVQQSFLVAFRKLGDFTVGTSFQAWLFAIARLELAQECRRRQREQAARGELLHAWLSASRAHEAERETPGPDRRLEALLLCLDRLSAAERRLIDARYRDRQSIRRIATAWQHPEGTIKKRLFVLRRWLKSCIGRRVSGEEE